MSQEKETVEQVCEKMKEPSIYKGRFPASFFDGEFCEFADRILAAHKREVDELRECLKEAIDGKCAMCAYRDPEMEAFYDNCRAQARDRGEER